MSADNTKTKSEEFASNEDTIDPQLSLEVASALYNESVQLLNENLEEAASTASESLQIAEGVFTNDPNNIKLAQYYVQYGKCLLRLIQANKDVFGGDDVVDIPNNDEQMETIEENEINNGETGENGSNNNDNLMNNGESKTTENDGIYNSNNGENNENNENEDEEDEEVEYYDENEENEETEAMNDRALAWEMLENARFIIENHLKKLGIKFDNKLRIVDNTDNNESKKDDSNNDNNNDNNNIDNSDQTEEKTSDLNDEFESEKLSNLTLLSEIHTLCGDHQLEDSEFNKSLDSYETALQIREYCNETHRELAFTHYMAALAASHAKLYEIMEQHSNDAIDLINDKMLNLIENFQNEKYNQRIENEELAIEDLSLLVNDFLNEYNLIRNNLSKEDCDDLDEIKDLIEMMNGILNKMQNDLTDAKGLEELEATQGFNIKELMSQILKQANLGNDNNNNNNDNTYNFGTNENELGESSGFGTFTGFNSNDMSNEEPVHTLSVKSKSSMKSAESIENVENPNNLENESKLNENVDSNNVINNNVIINKKRNKIEADIDSDEPLPFKKHKVNGKNDLKDVTMGNEFLNEKTMTSNANQTDKTTQ